MNISSGEVEVSGQKTFRAWVKQNFPKARTIFSNELLIVVFGHLPAIMLGQMMYWSDRTSDRAGWFYKSRQDWETELRMTEWEVRRSLDILRESGVVESKVVKVYGNRVSHFRVDYERLMLKFHVESTSIVEESSWF